MIGLDVTDVGHMVRKIEYCRIVAARIDMQLCRCPPVNAEHLAHVRRKMLEVADKLEGKPAR
jgi:sRNA-binding protein